MEHLADTVAVITGGASGIGFALARRFADSKMKIVLADIEQGALTAAETALRERGADVLSVRTDVADPEALERLADATIERFGKANVLCNNAGVQRSAPTWELSAKEWKWLIDVNLLGVVHGIRAFVPRMLAQNDACHLINTASFGGLVTAPYMSAYCATKSAVVSISECLRAELKGTSVGVSVLCPAFVKTSLGDANRNRPADLDAGLTAEQVDVRRNIGLVASSLVEAGVSTELVADCVLDALLNQRFYIITHPDELSAFRKRTDVIFRAGEEAREVLASRD